jgi:hypothetical protein
VLTASVVYFFKNSAFFKSHPNLSINLHHNLTTNLNQMKTSKLATFLLATTLVSTTFAQNNSNPYPITGNLGIGNPTPNFTLQLHGTTDYIVNPPALLGQPAPLPMNYGKTSRLGLTNTTTGLTNADGLLIRMSGTSGVIENLEKQDLILSSSSAFLRFSGSSNRLFAGNTSGSLTASTNAYFNVWTTDNGIYIKNSVSGKYGLSIQLNDLTDNAIQVMGTTGTTRNFAVKANGEVFARKYTTTLANIPDYVFQPDYKLMPLVELKQYINTNSHLPNVPSAQEFEQNGVDLGELNRVLLEKVEELTLYILELEERMKNLEEKQ